MASSTANSRPRTPSRSPAPPGSDVPSIPYHEHVAPPPRRSSFSFLRRGKSVERLNSKRSASGAKLTKKQKELDSRELIPQQAPKIPDIASFPTWTGENMRPDSYSIVSNQATQHHRIAKAPAMSNDMRSSPHGVPIPPMPGTQKGAFVDPYARTESMTNRGRYSYASSTISTINSPRRVRRRKDPTPFNILVVGARNSGKTSFIEFLRTSLVLPPRKQRPHARESDGPLQPQTSRINSNFVSHYLETEAEDGERIGLTIWDSEGLDANIVDLQLRELASFVESKFEETFNEENKVVRSPGVRDTHIHCVFLVLDPLRLDANINATRKARENNAKLANGSANVYASAIGDLSGLDNNLDLQVLRALQGKTTVVPVISKADTITTEHMAELKREIWGALKKANLDPLEPLGLEGDDDDDEEAISSDEDGVVKNRPRHNSKRFDERDEDDFSNTSHLESPSSSSSTSTVEKKPTAGSSDDSFPLPPGSSAGPHVPVTQTAPGAPILPLSIISPEPIVTHEPGPGRVARKFPWGSADPYNPEHCDFVRLKEAVFLEWRGDLREASREIWYEGWRTSRLNLRQTTATASVAAGRRQGQQQHAHQNLPVRSMMPDNGVGIAR